MRRINTNIGLTIETHRVPFNTPLRNLSVKYTEPTQSNRATLATIHVHLTQSGDHVLARMHLIQGICKLLQRSVLAKSRVGTALHVDRRGTDLSSNQLSIGMAFSGWNA